ncbi:winged helix DNA-binding domain-containing protein [Phytomonospora sp. NPDC050363]|uniref:winged helix DNA-binding domain-containing protein n=1 Tax=Phytomonospora sp. NPDC050363 TaxID=3155642 RepID=UPI0033C6CB0E
MSSARHIGAEERRARLGVRQLLAPGHLADSPEAVAEALVALHGSDPATVYLSIAARTGTVDASAVEQALYEDRTLVRMHAMRRTVFVFPADLVPTVQASTTDTIAQRERKTLVSLIGTQGFDDARLAAAEKAVLAALAEGPATGSELGAAVPELRSRFVYGEGKAYESTQSLGTRLLTLMAMEGRIVRGRPRGSWISGQFRWSLAPEAAAVTREHAQQELVRRWLTAYGPGTEADLKWWTGWPAGQVRKALAGIGAEAVTLDEGPGHVLPGDTEPVATPEPWAALLPALDPAPMARRFRDWFLDPAHRPELFDRSGNIGATVWWNGRVIGAWAQRADGEIVLRLFGDPGTEARTAVDAETARVAAWLGDTRVTPRFRTQTERELTA